MQIKTIPVGSAEGPPAPDRTHVVMLEVSGPIDHNDAVIQRARELVRRTRSPAMIESFEWAVQSQSLAKIE